MTPQFYVPDRGDVVWLDLDPLVGGHEQAGRRPAVVLSPRAYNELSRNLAIFCPITSRIKGFRFEVPVPASSGATGVIRTDQIKSLDWVRRRAVYIGEVPSSTIQDVTAIIATLLGL